MALVALADGWLVGCLRVNVKHYWLAVERPDGGRLVDDWKMDVAVFGFQ